MLHSEGRWVRETRGKTGYQDCGKLSIMSLLDRITVNPNQCGGRPCIRGLWIRVKDVLDLLAEGTIEAEILADYPYLEAEDLRAALAFAAAQSDHPVMQRT